MALANLSASANDTYIGGNFYMMWWLAGDALMKCGYVIADHATNDAEVIICSTSGVPFGVAALQADVDIDTLLTDGTVYGFYALHSGTALRLGWQTSGAAIRIHGAVSRSAAVAGTCVEARTAGATIGNTLEAEDSPADKWLNVLTTTSSIY